MYSILSFCGGAAVSPPLLPGPTVAARADRRAAVRAGRCCLGPAAAARADRSPRGPRPLLLDGQLGGHALTTWALDWEVMKCVIFCHQLDLNFIILFSTFYMDSTK